MLEHILVRSIQYSGARSIIEFIQAHHPPFLQNVESTEFHKPR